MRLPDEHPKHKLPYNIDVSILRRISQYLGAKDRMTHIVAGNVTPDFTLKSLDGKEFSLSTALERGPVLLAFFKIGCPTCQYTFPFIERLYQRFKGPNLSIVGISQNGAEKTANFNREYSVTFPVLLDEESKGYVVSNAYSLTNVPTILLVDSDGSVIVSSMGFVKKDLEAIANYFAERASLAKTPLFLPRESVPANKPG
jgi:peroxiredoxin